MKGRFKLNENFDKISAENYFNCFTNILCNPVENGLNQNHQEFIHSTPSITGLLVPLNFY
jgi:hypothetical protein